MAPPNAFPASTQASSPQQRQGADWDSSAAAGTTVVGALLVAWVVHKWNGARETRNRKAAAAAAARFREAFAPELCAAQTDTTNKINYKEFLRTSHDERHAQAIIAFEPFVPANKLSSFRSAWNLYRYGENADGTVQQTDPDDMDHDSLYFLEYSIEWDLRRQKGHAKTRSPEFANS